MSRKRRRKCLHCGELFEPDVRNRRHQRYCSQVPCRRASKAASHRRWLSKPENRDYYCGPHHVERVRRWRESHPGYWRRSQRLEVDALRDHCIEQALESTEKTATLTESALQERLFQQAFVLTGLIANLTGSALPEDIARSQAHLQQLGRDIFSTGDLNDSSITLPGAPPSDSVPVQLGRPATGPP